MLLAVTNSLSGKAKSPLPSSQSYWLSSLLLHCHSDSVTAFPAKVETFYAAFSVLRLSMAQCGLNCTQWPRMMWAWYWKGSLSVLWSLHWLSVRPLTRPFSGFQMCERSSPTLSLWTPQAVCSLLPAAFFTWYPSCPCAIFLSLLCQWLFFLCQAPVPWNSLPFSFCHSSHASCVKSSLKMHLFPQHNPTETI